MKKILTAALPLTIFIGTLVAMMTILTGEPLNETMTLSQESIQYGSYTWTFYKFHMARYLQSLETSIDPTQFKALLPTMPQLATTPNWTDILAILKFFVNTLLIYVTNWIIYTLNWLLLAPLKLLLYPIWIITSIIGVDMNYIGTQQLITNMYNLQIPLIPYI